MRPHLPDLLDWVAETGFGAGRVTSPVANWEDAPEAYLERTTKLVLQREPLDPDP